MKSEEDAHLSVIPAAQQCFSSLLVLPGAHACVSSSNCPITAPSQQKRVRDFCLVGADWKHSHLALQTLREKFTLIPGSFKSSTPAVDCFSSFSDSRSLSSWLVSKSHTSSSFSMQQACCCSKQRCWNAQSNWLVNGWGRICNVTDDISHPTVMLMELGCQTQHCAAAASLPPRLVADSVFSRVCRPL